MNDVMKRGKGETKEKASFKCFIKNLQQDLYFVGAVT